MSYHIAVKSTILVRDCMQRSNIAHILSYGVFNIVIPFSDICVVFEVVESLAALNAAEDAVHGDVREVGLVSAEEGCSLCVDGSRPVAGGVIQRLPSVFFDVVPRNRDANIPFIFF